MGTSDKTLNAACPCQEYVHTDMRLMDLLAMTDTLTGLGNRKYVEHKMDEMLCEANGEGQLWAIDLDGFKKIREEKGILFADEVICDVARLLCRLFPKGAIISRNEEDEFILLTVGGKSKEEMEKIAGAINGAIRGLYEEERIFCKVTASVGVACIPQHGKECTELLELAEKAVGYVKKQGGDGFAVYAPEYSYRHRPCSIDRTRRPELFEMLPRESITNYVFRFLSDNKDSESAVNMLLKRASELYHIDHCVIYLVQKEQMNMKCKYEGRKDFSISLYDQVLGFSQRGWQEHLDRVAHRKPCYLFDNQSVDKGRLAEVFSLLPENATIMQTALKVSTNYVGNIFMIDYTGKKVWTEEDKANLDDFAKVLGYYLLVSRRNDEFIQANKVEEDIDQLTGLYNSETFLRVTEEFVKGSEEEFVMVYLDIGNFKSINRTLGYDMGDRVLKECARMLKEEVLDVILVGRIYGDQFALLCRKDTPMNSEEILDNANRVNGMLQSRIREMCRDESILIHSGLYHISSDEKMDVALSRAKMAKNVAKQQWSGKLVVYESWMSDSAQKNYELIGNVDAAIANREFVVYLQPKVNSETMEIIGAEALIRWMKQDGTMVFPDEFIPIFEKNGRIIDVDYYVYEEVFRYLRKRMDEGMPVVPISMNVSRIHLKDDSFIDKVNELLDKYQISCEYLEFEITENVYVEKLQEALPFIENIRKKKIKVSIDDFGSGYSSLNVISSIPLDILKLDKAFMKRGGELTKKDRAVITHLVKLAKDIELEVLCEGVETQVQADFVKHIGCNAWQGYCFAKPMSMEEFDECLNHHKIKQI